jgi:alanine racemase
VIPEAEAASRRATRAIVDLDRIEANTGYFARLIAPNRHLIAVVKANGYGHGAVMTARTALAAGACRLAVATVDEGRHLRAAGITAPILIMGPISESECPSAVAANLELTVGSTQEVRAIAAAARAGSGAAIHIKIDTGMHRYGCEPEHVLAVASEISRYPELTVHGTYTHLACADTLDARLTDLQIGAFEKVVAELGDANLPTGLLHVGNSAATLNSSHHFYDAVRVGIALYGLRPNPEWMLPAELLPALKLRSTVARVSTLPAGAGVSYGWSYRAAASEQIGLIPIGYADGYPRALSSVGVMDIGGHPSPVLGRICMDQTVVGLASAANVSVGDEVLIAGGQGTAPGFDDMALALGTIAYELVTRLAARVPRHYVRGGKTVAVEDLSGLHEPKGSLE